jgi:hypothetical protein
MSASIFKNKANGETYSISFDLLDGEAPLEAAWGRVLRAVCRIKGWYQHDVTVVSTRAC